MESNLFVDARYVKEQDVVEVVTRVNGKRIYESYPADYSFYVSDPRGQYQTVYSTPVTKITPRTAKDFQKEKAIHNSKQLWESDINLVNKCLSQHFKGAETPELKVLFFDIEVNFDPIRGYAPTTDPFNYITAITCYLSWTEQCITFAIPPSGLSSKEAEDIASQFDNTFIFEKESEMLDAFLDLIDDADIISGWNSGGYDIPYTVNRVAQVLSKNDTRRFCLWNQYPKKRIFKKFGSEHESYDLIGRIHLDYMQLYIKYNYEERHSYALNAIGDYEIGESKVVYQGSLDELYNKDFAKFLDYNRQDVFLLAKLDKKLKFIDLVNVLAHEITIPLPSTQGPVGLTDQAIINRAHELNLVVPNKKHSGFGSSDDESDDGAAGAYVAYPKKGMHEWIGTLDINSLYPSAIRALNMGPEAIVGQIRPIYTDRYISEKMAKKATFAEAWEGQFGCLEYQSVMNQELGTILTVDWEHTNESTEMSANDLHTLIFNSNQKWMISANGTIFSYEKEAVIPGLLGSWYADRKILQKKKIEAIDANDKKLAEYYDKRQHVKKIQLNSAYGAILNEGSRFNDPRIGQSTTLNGRVITKHMTAFVNSTLTEEYNHTGESIIYGDTDSVIFSVWPTIKNDVELGKLDWNIDVAIEMYDNIADQVNESFPTFMKKAFNCPEENGQIIKCGREIVGRRGLFITKKRYAILILDLDGKRQDVDKPGKVKAMGLDLKRSDTPKLVQTFLSDILLDVLVGNEKEVVIQKVKDFKKIFKELPAWQQGRPMRVNNLLNYTAKDLKGKKGMIPGHVRGAMNWNLLKKMHGDNYSMEITDGMKVIVCRLKNNPMGYDSVSYPIDETRLPKWFTELPFDSGTMEDRVVDQKVENLIGILKWDIAASTQNKNTFNSLFSFDS